MYNIVDFVKKSALRRMVPYGNHKTVLMPNGNSVLQKYSM